jgi:hypothetical protein
MRAIAFVVFLIVSQSALAADVRCALVNSKDAILEFRQHHDVCPPDLPAKDWRWLSAPIATPPSYDANTQVLEGPTRTVEASAVTESYTVRSKTAEELNADKESRLNSLAVFVLKHLCDHESRIRVLEGKSAITFEQCREAIKAAL